MFMIALLNFLMNINKHVLFLAPSEPLRLQIVSNTDRSLMLGWEQPSEPNGQIRLYQIWYNEKYSTDGQLLSS